jgi:hypothetical protein
MSSESIVNSTQETLKFNRAQLLYDIKNYAFVEADVMGEERQHAQHLLADIGEAGNVDRVNRILALVHAEVTEMLYPYTKEEPLGEEFVDTIEEPTSYDITLAVPSTMSRTTLELLSKLIHEYMVYRVLGDWLMITNPQAAAGWMARAESAKGEINSAKHRRRVPLTRKMNP